MARLERDDFAVLFEDVTVSAVDNIAKRIVRVVHESMPVGGRLMQVRVNLGVVQAAKHE